MFLNKLKWSHWLKVLIKLIEINLIKIIKISKMIKCKNRNDQTSKSNIIKMSNKMKLSVIKSNTQDDWDKFHQNCQSD